VRDVKLHRRKIGEPLAGLHTPEGVRLPPNSLAELGRDVARLALVEEQITEIERTRLARLRQPPADTAHAMLATLARVDGLGIETADVLTHEVMVRNLRDRRAVARGACPRAGRRPDPGGGITGAPDESGARRRDKGLARTGNARVRRIMLQLAWRFLRFQKQSALAKWFDARTADGRAATRKTMILALARKLLIALWRLVTTGEVPQGVVLRPAV
jgi:transposase